MKHKSFASIPSFGDLPFSQVAFNFCAGCSAMLGRRLGKKETYSAFAASYSVFNAFHVKADKVKLSRTPNGKFIARTIDEAHPSRKFARLAFSHLSTQMSSIRRRDREARRLTRTQWLVYMQDAFDIFARNPNAIAMASDERRSNRHMRDSEQNYADKILEKAAQRNSLTEWADRRTNYGSGSSKFVVTQKFVNENS